MGIPEQQGIPFDFSESKSLLEVVAQEYSDTASWKDEFLTWFLGLKGQEIDLDKRAKIIEYGLKVGLKRDKIFVVEGDNHCIFNT